MSHIIINNEINDTYAYIYRQMVKDYSFSNQELSLLLNNKEFSSLSVELDLSSQLFKLLSDYNGISFKTKTCNIVINENGHLKGYNTYYMAFKRMIEFYNIHIENKKVLLIGNNNYSKNIYYVLKELKANYIYSASNFKSSNINNQDIEVIINTIPCDDTYNMDLNQYKNLTTVIDTNYLPYRSKLLVDASFITKNCFNGLYAMVYDVYLQANLIEKNSLKLDVVNKYYNTILFNNTNIVLIGMPSCGKTVIAKNITKKINRYYIDMDKQIELSTGFKCGDIILNNGEDYFRDLEANTIKNLKVLGHPISTGGGVIKRIENIKMLKENGIIIFVDRELDQLKISNKRPLTNSLEKLQEVYNERIDYYNSYSDIIIKSNSTIEETVEKLIKAINKNNFKKEIINESNHS